MPSLRRSKSRVEAYVRWLTSPIPGAYSVDRTVYLALAELTSRQRRSEVGRSLDLAPYELKVFSQNGEDGVLDEILRRIGLGNKTFVEFGAERGQEATCVLLADVGAWTGLFIEASPESFKVLSSKYELNPRVKTACARVTPGDVEATFAVNEVPEEPDVLSIDIDSHDYWVWQAIVNYRPRVVVIEYNAHLGLSPLTLPLDAEAQLGTDYFGASIEALQRLGTAKGYRLVHCDLTGVNAFFVREDLHSDRFLVPDQVVRRAPNFRLEGMRWRHQPGPWHSVEPQPSD